MSLSRFLALATASASPSCPGFRKGRQVRMSDAAAAPFVQAGALKPLGLFKPPAEPTPEPTPAAGADNLAAVSSVTGIPGETKEPVEFGVPEKWEGGDAGTPVTEPAAEPAAEPVTAEPVTAEPAAEPVVDQAPAEAAAEPVEEPVVDDAIAEPTTESEPEAEPEASPAEVTDEPDPDAVAPVIYEVEIDDADGSYTEWFNSLVAEQDLAIRFDATSGRPRVELPGDVQPELVSQWVEAFRAAYPDFANVTYSQIA